MGLKRAPEFEAWLEKMQVTDPLGRLRELQCHHSFLHALTDMTQTA